MKSQVLFLFVLFVFFLSCVDKEKKETVSKAEKETESVNSIKPRSKDYSIVMGPIKMNMETIIRRLFSGQSIKIASPIEPAIADQQRTFFNNYNSQNIAAGKVIGGNGADIVFKKQAFSEFLDAYKTRPTFNSVKIKITQIDKGTSTSGVYFNNDKKLHVLFYPAHTYIEAGRFKVEVLDTRGHDLSFDKYTENGNKIYKLSPDEETGFKASYENTTSYGNKKVLDQYGPSYIEAGTTYTTENTQSVYVNNAELKLFIDDMTESTFKHVIIKFGFYYSIDPAPRGELANKDKYLNLLFYRAKDSNVELPSLKVHNLNSHCPPPAGGCI